MVAVSIEMGIGIGIGVDAEDKITDETPWTTITRTITQTYTLTSNNRIATSNTEPTAATAGAVNLTPVLERRAIYTYRSLSSYTESIENQSESQSQSQSQNESESPSPNTMVLTGRDHVGKISNRAIAAAVVIPLCIMAILGLVFFFNYKKGKAAKTLNDSKSYNTISKLSMSSDNTRKLADADPRADLEKYPCCQQKSLCSSSDSSLSSFPDRVPATIMQMPPFAKVKRPQRLLVEQVHSPPVAIKDLFLRRSIVPQIYEPTKEPGNQTQVVSMAKRNWPITLPSEQEISKFMVPK